MRKFRLGLKTPSSPFTKKGKKKETFFFGLSSASASCASFSALLLSHALRIPSAIFCLCASVMKLSGFFFFNVVSLIFALCVSDMNPLGFFFPLRALLMACLCSALSDLRLLEGFLLELLLLGGVELLGGSSTTSDVDGSGVASSEAAEMGGDLGRRAGQAGGVDGRPPDGRGGVGRGGALLASISLNRC